MSGARHATTRKRRGPSTGRVLGLLLLAFLVAASSGPAVAEPARPNVIFYFIDTLRADHVHCMGYPVETTPALDALAARGTLFETAFAPSSWSLPSYCSTFASLHPPAHAVDEVRQYFDRSFVTLPAVLGKYGYDTGGFVGGSHLSRMFGLDNGFAVYQDQPHYGSFFHTVRTFLEWVDRPRTGPFFALVQGYDAHVPYQAPLGYTEMYDPDYRGLIHDLDILRGEVLRNVTGNVVHVARGEGRGQGAVPPVTGTGPLPPLPLRGRAAAGGVRADPARASTAVAPATTSPYGTSTLDVSGDAKPELIPLSPADRRHIIAHYDGTVSYADSWLSVLVAELDARKLSGHTILVVAGDHGESLGEHGYYGHRWDLYEEQLHVPLVWSGPGIARGRRAKQLVGLTDLAPTVLELCGIPPCRDFQGQSFAAHLSEKGAPVQPRTVFSSLSNRLSARTDRWHLVHSYTGQTVLFDVGADPTEQTDVSARNPDVTRALLGQALDWYEQYRREPRGSDVVLTPEEKQMFRSKGYW